MHLNIIVLLSVLSLAVHISSSYRVSAKHGNKNNRGRAYHANWADNIYTIDAEDDTDEASRQPNKAPYVGSLNDLLYLTADNNDDIGEAVSSTETNINDRLFADLLPKLQNEDGDDSDDEFGLPLSTSPSSIDDSAYFPSSSSSISQPSVDEEELESHSSLIGGQVHQYVSGGAGEGKQHLHPDGAIDNKEEVKSDEDLPAYCDPPNPCPMGVVADDCDPRPFAIFSAQFSKEYQEQQNCMCDDDHNECHKRSSKPTSSGGSASLFANLNVVAKKSPRVKREVKSDQNETKRRLNPYLRGEAIKIHVAKKSHPI